MLERWLSDDRRLSRLIGVALPCAVAVLGALAPRARGLTPDFFLAFFGLLLGVVLVDQTAPEREGSLWRKLLWLAAELALCFFVVKVHGTLVRPVIIFMVPAMRSLWMFGEGRGLLVSLSVWLVYSVNVGLFAWPHRLHEYFNYLSFFLAPYLLAVLATLATLRQSGARSRSEALYRELHAAIRSCSACTGRLASWRSRKSATGSPGRSMTP